MDPAQDTPRGAAELALFGAPTLELRDGRVLALQRKDAALLALLALDGPQPPGRIAALLWPEATHEQAASSLRQRLFRLRRQVGASLVETGDLMRLSADVRATLPEPRAAIAANPEACADTLLGALEFGEEEELDRWVGAARAAWRRKLQEALAAEASALESRSQWAAAIRIAQRIVGDDPLLEHGHRRLMRLHYLRGDRAAAIGAFERCRETLARELGVAPDTETLALASLIESADPQEERAPAPPSVATLRPPRLIGREAALRALAVARGSHRRMLVEGEAGSGKSRLLQAYVQSVGAAVCTGARVGDSQVAYSLLARLAAALTRAHGVPPERWVADEIARIAPDLGSPPTSALDPLRFRQAIERGFEHWHRAGAQTIVVDDLHHADDASVAALLGLCASEAAGESFWIFAVRPDEMPPSMRDWLRRARESDVMRLQVPPLDGQQTKHLLESLRIDRFDAAAWAEALSRHSRGNPQFLLETVRALVADPSKLGAPRTDLPPPASMQQMTEARLARLAPATLQIVRLVSLTEQDFTPELGARVLDRSVLDVAEAIGEAEASQLFDGGRFAHDLFAEATRRSTPRAVAHTLHARTAEALAAAGGEPARIAQHWHAAEAWPAAGAAYLRAAMAAAQVSQRRLEAQLADTAAACFERAGDASNAFDARERELRAAYFVDTFDKQVARAERLLALADGPGKRAAALWIYAGTLTDDAQIDKVIAAAREARMLFETLRDNESAGAVAALEARALAWIGQADEARQTIDRHLPTTLACRDERLKATALGDFGCALMSLHRPQEAEALFNAALELATSIGDWSCCQSLHIHAAWVHHYRADVLRTVQSYEAARRLSPRLGTENRPPNISEAILAQLYLQMGRFDPGLSLLEHTLETQQEGQGYTLVSVTVFGLCMAHLWLGQPGLAAAVLAKLPRTLAPGMSRRVALMALAQFEADQGRPALALLERAKTEAASEGSAWSRLTVDALIAGQLAPAQGAALALASCAESEVLGLARVTWPLKLAACDALYRSGAFDHAARLAAEIADRFAGQIPLGAYPPQYGWIAGRALRRVGHAERATQCLAQAARWIDQALPHVPAGFRDSFLERNAVNVAVLTASGASACAQADT